MAEEHALPCFQARHMIRTHRQTTKMLLYLKYQKLQNFPDKALITRQKIATTNLTLTVKKMSCTKICLQALFLGRGGRGGGVITSYTTRRQYR